MSFSFSRLDVANSIVEKHISVRAAADCSGYSVQYLRRMLRAGTLRGTKIGQVWLVDFDNFEKFVKSSFASKDRRRGPRNT